MICIFISVIAIIIIIFSIYRQYVENFAELPIKPDLASNKAEGEYSNDLYNDPSRIKAERQDVKENKSYSLQPPEMFFDIFNVNCTKPFERPWNCLLIKGNNVNNLPIEQCQKVCPDKFIKSGEEYEPIEQFGNYLSFMEKDPKPSHFYCYNGCKKNCTKYKYNPLEPWKNSCGQNGFSQVPLNVYLSEKECLADSLPCEKLDKEQCINNSKCGYCTNNSGQGFCFQGTTEGPLDVTIPCVPDREKPTNAYFNGAPDPFKGIQQSWN